jgi:hypothetical protein
MLELRERHWSSFGMTIGPSYHNKLSKELLRELASAWPYAEIW